MIKFVSLIVIAALAQLASYPSFAWPKKVSSAENIQLRKSYYYKAAQQALSEFQEQSFSPNDNDLDVIFYKIEKRVIYQNIKNDARHFNFDHLTNEVVKYIQILKNNYDLSLDLNKRALLQLNFYGLSQAIKKANEINLNIQASQFDKLHDLLLTQSTSLFYASYKQIRYTDFFWTSYFLHELSYPMDLTTKHLAALTVNKRTFKHPDRYREYGEKLARLSLGFAQKLAPISGAELEVLYMWALGKDSSALAQKIVQKNYLKQLQLIGDNDKAKKIKKEIAGSLLREEGKALFSNPLNVLKFLQILIGYIFVAWPLEMILLVVAISIFTFQSRSVLNEDEARMAKKFHKRIWIMFTKSYLGRDVPFFSKLAASLVLFGIGLYFNSAKNFVETLISGI